jgi:hypothetical protein
MVCKIFCINILLHQKHIKKQNMKMKSRESILQWMKQKNWSVDQILEYYEKEKLGVSSYSNAKIAKFRAEQEKEKQLLKNAEEEYNMARLQGRQTLQVFINPVNKHKQRIRELDLQIVKETNDMSYTIYYVNNCIRLAETIKEEQGEQKEVEEEEEQDVENKGKKREIEIADPETTEEVPKRSNKRVKRTRVKFSKPRKNTSRQQQPPSFSEEVFPSSEEISVSGGVLDI